MTLWKLAWYMCFCYIIHQYSYDIKLYNITVLNYMIQYCIIWNDIVNYFMIYFKITYRMKLYHMILLDRILYQIIQYCIIWSWIIWYSKTCIRRTLVLIIIKQHLVWRILLQLTFLIALTCSQHKHLSILVKSKYACLNNIIIWAVIYVICKHIL